MKHALVTGATSGLGREICLLLRERGFQVTGVARRAIAEHGLVNRFLAGDVASKAFSSKLSNFLLESEVTHVFNAAGVGEFGHTGELSLEQISRMVNTNLIGPISICESAIRSWKMKNTSGMIINILSTAAFTIRATEAVYCATKAGLKMYTDCARADLKGSGINLVNVFPGGVNTPFWSQSGVDATSFMDLEEVARTVLDSVLTDMHLLVSDITINRS